MLKFQLATPADLKVTACIERKRQLEADRKSRIFNPRIRKIGVDKEFLDRQIVEKQKLRELERERECRMDEALVRSSHYALALEKKEEEERKRLNREISNFRQIHQRLENRRDFDLCDRNQLRQNLVDNDPLVGPASAQIFEGEDSKQSERLRIQKEQMQAWLMQQVCEKRQSEKARQNADDMYHQAVISRDKRALSLGRIEEECRRQLNKSNAQFNRALAAEQEHRRRCEALKDDEDKRAEIYNQVTGDFLTEAKEQAASIRGPKKPLGYRYKGMTSDELKDIFDTQARQMSEIRRIKLEEKRRDDEWERLMLSNARVVELNYREIDEKKQRIRQEIAEENLRLAQQQKSRQEYLNQMVYKNVREISGIFCRWCRNISNQ